MNKQRKVSEITKDLIKSEYYKVREELVEFHILHVNPSYLKGHVMVASKLYQNEFIDMNSYKTECEKYGIFCYEEAFQPVLRLMRSLRRAF